MMPRFDSRSDLLRSVRRGGLMAALLGLALVPDWPGILSSTTKSFAGWADRRGADLVAPTVYVSGAKRTALETVAEKVHALGLQASPNDVRTALQALPWVAKAHVRRHALGPWHIRLEERVPYARWQTDQGRWVVDRAGRRIVASSPDRYGALPLLSGAGAPAAAPRLLPMLETEPALARRIHALIRLGDRRWDILFENGITLSLPEPSNGWGPDDAWAAFARLNRRHRLLDREIITVDMRLRERLTFRLTERGKAMIHAEKRRS